MSDHNDNPELELFQADDRSQFDLIKNVRADGSEFWSARELMVVMGYTQWRNFEVPLDRAMTAAANQEVPVDSHFARSRKVVERPQGGGNERADFHLSRFAAYLVAMNGDPNKMEVAAAQSYFAIRTREAETRPALDLEKITRGDLARMILEAEEEKAVLSAALESAAPAIEYHDRHIAVNSDLVLIEDWGRLVGLTKPKAFDKLVEKNIIFRKVVGEHWSGRKQRVVKDYEYRARAGRATTGWFELRPQHDAPRLHNGQVKQTLMVKVFFVDKLADKCGLSRTSPIDGLEGGAA